MLQPADVSWMRSLKVAYYEKWTAWMRNSPRSFTASGNLRSPGYVKIINWINEIWKDFDREIIINSFDKCGITSADSALFHRQLRHFENTNELVEYVDEDDGTDDLDAFIVNESSEESDMEYDEQKESDSSQS